MAQLPELTDHDWDGLVDRLTLYAHCRFARLIWRGVTWRRGGSAPGAAQPADIAADAIVSVLDETRTWDQAKYPDFFDFLKGVVDSKISHLVRSIENRKQTRMPRSPAGDTDCEFEDLIPSSEPQPDVALADDEAVDKLRAKVRAAVEKDPIGLRVFECLDAGITKRAEIAEMLGISEKDVDNARKRLARVVEKLLYKPTERKESRHG